LHHPVGARPRHRKRSCRGALRAPSSAADIAACALFAARLTARILSSGRYLLHRPPGVRKCPLDVRSGHPAVRPSGAASPLHSRTSAFAGTRKRVCSGDFGHKTSAVRRPSAHHDIKRQSGHTDVVRATAVVLAAEGPGQNRRRPCERLRIAPNVDPDRSRRRPTSRPSALQRTSGGCSSRLLAAGRPVPWD
jgi:hypothetical protein